MKRWFIPVLAVLSLGLAVLSVARTRPDRAPEPPPIAPPATPFAESVAAVGLVEANTENIAIGSHLSGVVARVHIVVGQAVEAADALFTLDDRHLRAALALHQGRLGRARARVRTGRHGGSLPAFLLDRGRRPAERGGQRFLHRRLGPAIHWPIFNAGRIRDNIEVQDLRQEQALLAYRQTVLLGLEEVENALVTHREARLRFQEICEAEGAERRAVALAHDRYRSGLVDFLDVLETERTFYAAQTELARGERAVGQDLVRLYKALGGGWGHEVAQAQATQPPQFVLQEEQPI